MNIVETQYFILKMNDRASSCSLVVPGRDKGTLVIYTIKISFMAVENFGCKIRRVVYYKQRKKVDANMTEFN